MTAFVTLTEKPHIYRQAGVWCCAGIRKRWYVFETVCFGYGATPAEAFRKWKMD